jgi:hypothetical protein
MGHPGVDENFTGQNAVAKQRDRTRQADDSMDKSFKSQNLLYGSVITISRASGPPRLINSTKSHGRQKFRISRSIHAVIQGGAHFSKKSTPKARLRCNAVHVVMAEGKFSFSYCKGS